MKNASTKYLSIPKILDSIERAEMAVAVSWPADRPYALWQHAKPKGTPAPEWFDPEDEEEIDLDIDVLRGLLREALWAEMIRARARGELTVIIEEEATGVPNKH